LRAETMAAAVAIRCHTSSIADGVGTPMRFITPKPAWRSSSEL
jgi:hypothetical protein